MGDLKKIFFANRQVHLIVLSALLNHPRNKAQRKSFLSSLHLPLEDLLLTCLDFPRSAFSKADTPVIRRMWSFRRKAVDVPSTVLNCKPQVPMAAWPAPTLQLGRGRGICLKGLGSLMLLQGSVLALVHCLLWTALAGPRSRPWRWQCKKRIFFFSSTTSVWRITRRAAGDSRCLQIKVFDWQVMWKVA